LEYEFHELADIFPLMSGDEFDEFKKDIKENGVQVPIEIYKNEILDGRNRYLACKDLGVVPEFKEWSGNGSLISHVISLNLQRRHLTSSQRAVIALDVLPMLEMEAKERMIAGTNQHSSPPALMQEGSKGESSEQAAKLLNTSPRYVAEAKSIQKKSPEKIKKIQSGELTITEAKRQIKEEEREVKREENRALVESTHPVIHTQNETQEKYQTIVIDPPWDWGDEGDQDQYGRARPTYSTMSIDEVAALPLEELSQSNAHIYLWITNRSLPKGFALLEKWGFRYVTCLTWCKPSIGMGNYFRGSTEQILFGVKGSLPILKKNVGTWFEAKRTGIHSGKPDKFFNLVEECSPGPWMEMFARSNRNGWASWGAESVK
jgi:N6-adenosine-specific RNA methylase IME4